MSAPAAVAAGSRPMPTAPGLPLVGSALAIARDPLGFLVRAHRELGPIFRVRAAHQDLVVMAGEEANAFVHGEGRACFSNRRNWAPTLREMGAPNSFVGLDGELHASLRKAMAPQFARRLAEARLPAFVELTAEALAEHAPGDAIPFVAFGKRLASRQIGSALVGRVPTPEEHEAILRYTNAVLVALSLRRLPAWTLRLRGPRFRRDKRLAVAFGERVVREHLADPDREENFIDAVVASSEAHPGLFQESEIRVNGMLPFFAGVDTVGQTIGFLVYEVLRDPELHARLRAEADALFEGGAPDARALRRAPDLQGAVLEALRRYPVAFAMPRHAACAFTFQGHRVAEGQAVLVFTSACHFQPEHFPEPERFDIERYRPPRNEHQRPDVFAPFGRGPHQCLGAAFAQIQLAAMLASLLHHAELALPDPGRTFTPVLRPSLSMGEGFRVRFEGWRHEPGAAREAGAARGGAATA